MRVAAVILGFVAALHAGIPQIATPAPGDRRWNATLLERSGTGSGLVTAGATSGASGALLSTWNAAPAVDPPVTIVSLVDTDQV